jgi:hypothetical protein
VFVGAQAIQAAKEVLRVCDLNEETSTTAKLNGLGCRFLCKSCPVPIVMDASSVVSTPSHHGLPSRLITLIFQIGHSKRHKRITLELLEQDQANAILHTPLQRGLTSKLLGFTKSGKRERNQCTWVMYYASQFIDFANVLFYFAPGLGMPVDIVRPRRHSHSTD